MANIAAKGSKTLPFVIYAVNSAGTTPKRRAAQSLGAWQGNDAQDAMTRCQRFYDGAATDPGRSILQVVFCTPPSQPGAIILFDRASYKEIV